MVIGWLEAVDKVQTFYDIAIKPFVQRRAKELQAIIESELRDGDFSRVHEDEKISIIYRLMNDINEGVGKNNIKLLARVIVGLNKKEQLTASRFHDFNNILASLSHEQIVFIAEVIKAFNNPLIDIMSKEMKEQIAFSGIDPKDVASVKKAVKNTNGSHILLSLLKTGFFQPSEPKWSNIGSAYKVSPLFIEFIDLIDNWDDIANWSEE